MTTGAATEERVDAPDHAADPGLDAAAELSSYDFSTPLKTGLPRQAEMMEVLGEYTGGLEPWLGARFREHVSLSVVGLELAPFRVIREGLRKPCNAFLFSVKEASDRIALLTVGSDLVFAAVERLMGGSGQPVVLERVPTRLEQRVVGLIVNRMLEDYVRNWREHVTLTFAPEGFEASPEMLSVAAREDRYFGVRFAFRGETWEGGAALWLPTQAMDAYLSATPEETVSARVDPAIQHDRDNVRGTLLTAHVAVHARLPAFSVPLRVLADLQEGVVLPTRLSTDAPIELWIGGQRRFLGTPGRSGRALAVRVSGPAPQGPPEKNSHS